MSCKALHHEKDITPANAIMFKTGFITLEEGTKYAVGLCSDGDKPKVPHVNADTSDPSNAGNLPSS